MSDFMQLPEKQQKTRKSYKKSNEKIPHREERFSRLSTGKENPHVEPLWEGTGMPQYASGFPARAAHYTLEEHPLPGAPVLQAEGHITVNEDVKQPDDGMTLPDSEWPTIIFEAMGTGLAACRAVYDESCRYPGNTICIYGLNMRREQPRRARDPLTDFDKDAGYLNTYAGELAYGMDVDFLNAVENEKGSRNGLMPAEWQNRKEQERERQPGQNPALAPLHLLYTFSFTWRKPEDVTEGDAYMMPFVEARGIIMEKAAAVRGKFQGDGGQYHFLYRWIDGDARDDTTSEIGAGRLEEWAASEDVQVITGRYDWRHADEGTAGQKENYHKFIERLNDSEKRLRDFYYELARRSYSGDLPALADKIIRIQHARDYGDDKRGQVEQIKADFAGIYPGRMEPWLENPDSYGYLPGYYFPETALMMNETAHDRMTYVTADRSRQDKESMKIASRAVSGLDGVSYVPELVVTKPLKNEFTDETYLGADLLAFFRGTDGQSKFIVALKNVRQSAFQPDKWFFINDADWAKWETEKEADRNNQDEIRQQLFNGKRREEMNALWAYLMETEGRFTVLQKIRAELR